MYTIPLGLDLQARVTNHIKLMKKHRWIDQYTEQASECPGTSRINVTGADSFFTWPACLLIFSGLLHELLPHLFLFQVQLGHLSFQVKRAAGTDALILSLFHLILGLLNPVPCILLLVIKPKPPLHLFAHLRLLLEDASDHALELGCGDGALLVGRLGKELVHEPPLFLHWIAQNFVYQLVEKMRLAFDDLWNQVWSKTERSCVGVKCAACRNGEP